MVTKFGMSDLGPIDFEGDRQNVYEQSDLSPAMAAKVDAEVKKMSETAYQQALGILTKLRDKLDLLANELLKKETMDADEFVKLIGPKVTPAVAKA
jgi:cell division protease FtsH